MRRGPSVPAGSAQSAALFVHGLWMPGEEAAWLRRRLWRERGLRVEVFRYRSMRGSMREFAAALSAAIEALAAPRVHLIGHSLGGLIVYEYLTRYTMQPPGRVVLLGTPASGSRCAQRFACSALGRRLLGGAGCEALLPASSRQWGLSRELAVIAGALPIGFGRLVTRFDEPNDGTVAVAETVLPGAQARLVLPVSHLGLLFSATAAREIGSFLEHGRFGH